MVDTPPPRKLGGLLALLLAVFLATFLAPLPTLDEVKRLLPLLRSESGERTVVVGNSIVDHVSACDADRRTIPEMLGDAGKRTVLDLSEGGQPLPLSTDLAALALKRPGVGTVVVFASLNGFAGRDALDLRSAAFFRLAAGDLSANDLAGRLARGTVIAPEPSFAYAPFRYRDAEYPGYEGIKARYFAAEKRAMPCPETPGADRTFIEAYHWANFARARTWPGNLADLGTLAAEARRRAKRFLVVLLPINYGDLGVLVPDLVPDIRRRAAALTADLRAAKVDLLDLQETQPDPTVFADRWCACGHLGQAGRLAVAEATAKRLAGPPALARGE